MSDNELDHWVKMINQIADNIAIGESDDIAASKVSAHIKRFWARRMRDGIIRYVEQGGELKPVAKAAVNGLMVKSTQG